MGGWYWRLRVAIADNFAELVVTALLVGTVGGYVTYTAAGTPATETVARQTSSWQSTGEVVHSATVRSDTTAFAEGRVLRNRSVYFLGVTPELDGAFVYGYQASDSGDLDVNTSITLRYQSVSPSAEGSRTVYWRVERRLAESTATLAPGERSRTPFTVSVSDAVADTQRIDDELGGTPGTQQVVVVATTEISGTLNGRPVDRTRVNRTRIIVSDGTYFVRDDGPWPASGGQQQEVTVPVEPGILREAGGPALLVVGLAGLGGLGLFRRSEHFTVTDAQRELSGFESEREEFDEWITTGTLPASTFAETRIEVDSLAGLVDVAIDSERRVIEDTERDVFAVLTDGYRYMYYPPKGLELVDESRDDGESAADSADDDAPTDSADDDAPTDSADDDAPTDSADDGSDAGKGATEYELIDPGTENGQSVDSDGAEPDTTDSPRRRSADAEDSA